MVGPQYVSDARLHSLVDPTESEVRSMSTISPLHDETCTSSQLPQQKALGEIMAFFNWVSSERESSSHSGKN